MARTDPLGVALSDVGALAAEVVLPAQLRWGARHDSRISGPRALMLALLEDAIHCLLTPHGSGSLAREAEAWIWSDDPAWPMSFPNVCDALGFAPETLRAALLARAASAEPRNRRWTIRLRSSREQRGVIRMRRRRTNGDRAARARRHRR